MFNSFIVQKNNKVVHRLVGLLSIVLPILLLLCWVFIQERSVLTWTLQRCIVSTFYVGGGLILAFILYAGRLRFWLPTLFLLLVQWGGELFLNTVMPGEFDRFDIYSAWLINSTLFGIGWFLGWSLQRFRLGVYVFFFTILLVSLHSLSLGAGYSVDSFLGKMVPPFLGIVWCIFTYELWRTFNFSDQRFIVRYWGRYLVGLLILGFLLGAFIRLFYRHIEVRLVEYSQQQKSSEQLEKKRDGKMANKTNMGLGAMNQRNNNPNPLFCAHINFNFPDSDIPNPLYMVSYHFNRFDTLTETFERDTLFQYSDEFVPSPANYAFFQTFTDSSVLESFEPLKLTQEVETDVYTMQLSNEAFVAPSTAFSVRPFPVDAQFKTQYHAAYKARSRVSLLNSAYWVYNARDPMLQAFQEQRFSVLQTAGDVNKLPARFLSYYTQFPRAGIYQPLKQLADSLQQGKQGQLDKVLAVRDYFLQLRSDGSAVYRYADNPGIPGLPGASRLLYFMFESKRGYCAYYAASTVALLRLMGVPSRVVTGFMTVDRSDKNKGWYWFYEDQAHAWVQVYFPKYGWMDFDTTVGDEDAQESPKPDATPPTEPKTAWLVLQGNLVEVDSTKKTMLLHVQDAVVQQTSFHALNDTLLLDVSKQVFWNNSVKLTWRDFKKGQRVSAISYSVLDVLESTSTAWHKHITVWKKPIPIDEVYRLPLPSSSKTELEEKNKPLFLNGLRTVAFLLLACFILLLCMPRFSYYYFSWQVKRSRNSLYPSYYKLLYVLHMAGYSAEQHSMMHFAQHHVDPALGISFSAWLQVYWQEKYGGTALDEALLQAAQKEADDMEKKILNNIPSRTQRWMWFSLNRYFRFWELNSFFKH